MPKYYYQLAQQARYLLWQSGILLSMTLRVLNVRSTAVSDIRQSSGVRQGGALSSNLFNIHCLKKQYT